MSKPLWQQVLDGSYDPMRAVRSGSSGGGWRDDGTFETAFEARQRREREAEEREREAEQRERDRVVREREQAERERERQERDLEQQRREQDIEDWIAVGRGRDEDLRQITDGYNSRVEEAAALGLDEDGAGDPGLLETVLRAVDRPRAEVFEAGRQVANVLTGGDTYLFQRGQEADELREEGRQRVEDREGFGDTEALRWDDDDAWWERGGKAIGAFLGDVATDPVTYLSFGTASIGRRAAGEGADAAARKLGRDALGQVSDDQMRSLARRVSPREFREKMARQATREGRRLDASDIERMSPDETWTLARGLSTPEAGAGSFAQEIALRGLGAGSAESYLHGGSRGLRRFLTQSDTLGREVGEAAFRMMPNEIRGGVRFRVPFARDRSPIGTDLGVRLPRTVNMTGGGGRTSQYVPGLDRALDAAEWPRRAFRESAAGQQITSKLGGRSGWAYGPMVSRLSSVTDGEVGRAYSDYSTIVAATRESTTASGELSNKLAASAGAMRTALKSSADRQAAERSMQDAFMSRGTWGGTAEARAEHIASLAGDERIGYQVADEMFAVFDDLHREATLVFGETRAVGFLNDYLPRIARQEWKDSQRLGGRRIGGKGPDHLKERSGVFATWEQDGSGRARIARFWSPDEANEAAGQRMFEDDPLAILTSYANTMQQGIRQQRFLKELMDRGMIAEAGWSREGFLSSPQMAQVGADAAEGARAQQRALQEAFEEFARTGDRGGIRQALRARGASMPARRSTGREPAAPEQLSRPDRLREKVRERQLERELPAGRAPSAPDLPEQRVASSARLRRDGDGYVSADGRVATRRDGDGWVVEVDGVRVRPEGSGPLPGAAAAARAAADGPSLDDVAPGAGAARAAVDEPTVAPGAIEEAAVDEPADVYRLLFENDGVLEGGEAAFDSAPQTANAIFALNEGTDAPGMVVRRLTPDEQDEWARVNQMSAPEEVEEFVLAPERLDEARRRFAAEMDRRSADQGWAAQAAQGDLGAELQDAFIRRRTVKLADGGLPSDPDEFAAMWPVIRALEDADWQLGLRAADWDPAQQAHLGLELVMRPPSNSNAAMERAADALADVGLDVPVVRPPRITRASVDVEVDLSDLSDEARSIVSRMADSLGGAVRGGKLQGKYAGLAGKSGARDGLAERLDEVVDLARHNRKGVTQKARNRYNLKGVRFRPELVDELDYARNQIGEGIGQAAQESYRRMPRPQQLWVDRERVAQQAAGARRAAQGDEPTPSIESRNALRERQDQVLREAGIEPSDQARVVEYRRIMGERADELEGRLSAIDRELADAGFPAPSPPRPIPRKAAAAVDEPTPGPGPVGDRLTWGQAPDAPGPARFPTRRAAVEAANEQAAAGRQAVARAGYDVDVDVRASHLERRADVAEGGAARVQETVPAETHEQLLRRQQEWDRRATRTVDYGLREQEADAEFFADVQKATREALDDLTEDAGRIGELFDARNIPADPADADAYLDDIVQVVGRALSRRPSVVEDMMTAHRRKVTEYGQALQDEGLTNLVDAEGMNQATAALLDRIGAMGPEWLAQPLARMYRSHGAPSEWQSFERAVWKPYYTWFKSMATVGGGPRFWIRNMQGGAFNAWLADVTPSHFALGTRVLQARRKVRREVSQELGDTTRQAIDAETTRRLPAELKRRFGDQRGGRLAQAWQTFERQNLDQGQMLHIYDTPGVAANPAFREIDARTLRQQGLRPDLQDAEKGRVLRGAERTMDNPAFGWLADMTEGSERWLRFGTYLKGVEQYGMDDGGVAASMVVKATQFDYADLSEFEIRVLKNVLPFYTWTRFNVPLAARSVVTEPGKVQRVMHANDALADQYGAQYEDGDNAVMPRWVRESFGWELRSRPGDGDPDAPPWAVNLGWWPTSDLNRTFNATINPFGVLNTEELRASINPVAKAAAEAYTGTSSFTRAPFQPSETAPGWARLLPGATSETLSGETVTDPKFTNFVRSTVPLVGTADRTIEPLIRRAAGADLEEDRYQDRLGTTLAAQFGGVPVSTLDGRQQRAELLGRTDRVRGEMRKFLGTGDAYADNIEVVRELLEAGWTAEEIARALQVQGSLPIPAGG